MSKLRKGRAFGTVDLRQRPKKGNGATNYWPKAMKGKKTIKIDDTFRAQSQLMNPGKWTNAENRKALGFRNVNEALGAWKLWLFAVWRDQNPDAVLHGAGYGTKSVLAKKGMKSIAEASASAGAKRKRKADEEEDDDDDDDEKPEDLTINQKYGLDTDVRFWNVFDADGKEFDLDDDAVVGKIRRGYGPVEFSNDNAGPPKEILIDMRKEKRAINADFCPKTLVYRK